VIGNPITPPTEFIAGPPFLSKLEYDQANSSVTGPLQKPDRREEKEKLARSEGEQVLGTNRASKITILKIRFLINNFFTIKKRQNRTQFARQLLWPCLIQAASFYCCTEKTTINGQCRVAHWISEASGRACQRNDLRSKNTSAVRSNHFPVQ
jgi:hypothetical protein